MKILVHLERSASCAEFLGKEEGRIRTIEIDASDGPWVQFTYEGLRTQDGGDAVVAFNAHSELWDDGTEEYSDMVIEFAP